jgi:hypothetical protein
VAAMKKSTVLIFFLLSSFCFFTPLYRQETTDFVIFEDRIEALTQEWTKDAWGKLNTLTEYFKEKLFDGEDVQSISTFERNKQMLTYGFGYGYNALGSAEKSYHFIRFRTYQKASLFAGILALLLLIQLLFLLVLKWRYLLPFSALLCILCLLLFMGFGAEDVTINTIYGGVAIAIVFQLVILSASRMKQATAI